MISRISTHIHRPLSQVFQFVTRAENQSKWQAATVKNTQITPGEMRVGVQMRHTGKWLGRKYESIAQVIEYEPNRAWGYKSVSGPYDLVMRYRFETVKDGMRLAMEIEGNTKGFFGLGTLTEPLVGFFAHRMVQSDLVRLKQILEGDETQVAFMENT